MQLLWWTVIGLVGGWLAGKILKGDGYGPFMDVVMGIGGAVTGGLLMRSAGLAEQTLAAVIGAVAVTLAAGFVNGKRRNVGQL